MHIIVGLGNPGERYAHTRHNAGFLVIDRLSEIWGMSFKNKPAVRAQIAEGFVDEQKVVLVKPQTFMNDSGLAVQAVRAMFGVEASHVVVVSDDVDLPFPAVRVRTTGGSGGHNGLKSVIAHLNSPDFIRIRIGVNPPPVHFPLEEWVLGNFSPEQQRSLLDIVPAIGKVIERGLREGFRDETL